MKNKSLFRRNYLKFVTGYGIALIVVAAMSLSLVVMNSKAILDILASSLYSFSGATTTVFFRSYGDTTLDIGGTTSVDLNVSTKVPVNALDITVTFPKDELEVLGISKEHSFFDLWTEDTTISEDSGEIHFSGGTTKPGGLMGTGTMITIQVRAKSPGTAELKFSNVQVYASDGSGTQISTIARPISYSIEGAKESGTVSGNAASISAPAPRSAAPSADFNGDGKINLIDLSILSLKILAPYDSRYDLNLNGSVGLDDISILMSKMGSATP